jgi:Lar family restriction alleviation protein
MTPPTILQCPFCGYDDVEIMEIQPGRWSIDCPDCECIGPFADSVDEAIANWNKAARKDFATADMFA